MEKLVIGMHVDIQRRNGRVHGAVVAEVRDNSSVLVEWTEGNETKGKEVSLIDIFRMNPSLRGDPSLSMALKNSRLSCVGVPAEVAEEDEEDENQMIFVPPAIRKESRREITPNRRVTLGADAKAELAVQNRAEKLPHPKVTRRSVMTTPMRTKLEKIDDDMEETRTVDTSKILPVKGGKPKKPLQLQNQQKPKVEHGLAPSDRNYQFMTMIQDFREHLEYRPLKITDTVSEQRITVCVRKRPMNKKELNRKEIEVLTIPSANHIYVHQPQTKVDLTKFLENQKFRFDYTFDESAGNDMVYRFTAQPLVRSIFEKGFATCFAYGQTGSGKTHTMGGDFNGKSQDCSRGIYALTASDVFRLLNKEYRHEKLTVGCSFFEIYGGKVFDLLKNKALLRVLEDAKKEVQVVGLQEEIVNKESEVLNLIKKGTEQRTAGTTSANTNSSRSHAVFQIILRKNKKVWGKFSLIDLAGNERGQDTAAANRQTRQEGGDINKSLLALKECIRAMAKSSSHVPFRASKLTLVLRDSFIGEKARTCMIAMVSPGMASVEHTLNTLRYADRVKELGADGSSSPISDDNLMLNGEEGEEADLSLVCARNGASFEEQRRLAELQKMEENAIEGAKRTIQDLRQIAKEFTAMLKTPNNPVYDQKAFVVDMLQMYGRINAITRNDALEHWKEAIDEEDSTLKMMKK